MATIAPTFQERHAHTFKLPQPSRAGVKTTISPPFDIESTLTFDAIEYWAKVDPHRTALITTPKQWKCDQGKLVEKHDIDHEVEWTTVTYGEFWEKVQRTKAALHQAGIPSASTGNEQPRLLVLYAPANRADVLALLIALQTTGCTLLFGNPEAFGGIRNFMETMLTLEPDFVLANKLVYTIFRGICMTLSSKILKKKPTWIKSSVLTKVAPRLTDQEIQQYASLGRSSVTLDSVTAIMFSSGTTGPPTPIEISQRMLSFQATGYAQLLQKHLGAGVIRDRTSITGTMGDDHSSVLMSKRDGPWTSTHVFVNFVMLDLVLGGTAVMQPMGLSCPDRTVDAPTLLAIWNKFQTQVTSAPPALWRRLLKLQQQQRNTKQQLPAPTHDSMQLAFIGGSETSHRFARSLAKEFFQSEGTLESGCGLYRVYGTTQVLPIAMASDYDILNEESAHGLSTRGYGVCLGRVSEGLEVAIDTEVWERKGGQSQLASYHDDNRTQPLKLGELCTLGKAISPSMEVAGKPSPYSKSAPTRIFRSGDIAYVDPATKYIYFLGRMAHAVDCGGKLIAPVGVEMVALETGLVDRCAFVGAPHAKTGAIVPTLVVQFEGEQEDSREQVVAACRTIRTALEQSVWAPVLKTKLSLAVYPKTWPADTRHSSKTNRLQLRDWAAKADQHKLFSIM